MNKTPNLSRRGFLIGSAALLAAPAIVRASSLMPLWIPKQPELVFSLNSLPKDLQNDPTLSFWYKEGNGEWKTYSEKINSNRIVNGSITVNFPKTFAYPPKLTVISNMQLESGPNL